MYHLTRLSIPNINADQVYDILGRILIAGNARTARKLYDNIVSEYEEGELFDLDMDFDEDLHECLDPALMNLPKGAKAYTYYTKD